MFLINNTFFAKSKCFIFRFANNKIVRVYSLVLENYRTNSDELNHAVVKMLYTIAIKHEMTPMLFQISLFRIFSKILDEPPLRRYQVIITLSYYMFDLQLLLLGIAKILLSYRCQFFPLGSRQ